MTLGSRRHWLSKTDSFAQLQQIFYYIVSSWLPNEVTGALNSPLTEKASGLVFISACANDNWLLLKLEGRFGGVGRGDIVVVAAEAYL